MGEYIEREAFKETICEWCNACFEDDPCEPSECDILSILRSIPAADVRPVVRGKWVEHYEPYSTGEEMIEEQFGYECSVCGRWEYEKEPFCNCGADMRTGAE